tara:strand:- start:11080 stop:11220 length:141 start_codon:yes stop_codon:yes gene_type:complete
MSQPNYILDALREAIEAGAKYRALKLLNAHQAGQSSMAALIKLELT